MCYKAYLVVTLFILGAVLVTGFNFVPEKTDTPQFCISCHSIIKGSGNLIYESKNVAGFINAGILLEVGHFS